MTILHDNLYTTRAGTSTSDLQYLTRPTQWKALGSRKTSTGQAGRIRTGMYQRDVGQLWPNPRPLPQEHVRRWHRVRWMISLRIDSETRRTLQTHPMKNHQSLKGQLKKVRPRVHHWLPPRPLPQVRPRVHHWLPPRPLPQVRPRPRPQVHLRLPPLPLHRPRRWSKRERMHHRMHEKSHLQVRASRQSPIMM